MVLIQKYFPDLSPTQVQQFRMLDSVYREWNERINVISRKDIDHLYERHVLHSLSVAKVVQFADGTKVLDAGTGGGFPGIPLAIYFPQTHFHLVDSIGKKIKVVNEVVAHLGLKNVTAEQARVETLKEKYDFAISRAVAPVKEMAQWLKPLIQKGNNSSLPNGLIFLKGGDLKNEVAGIKGIQIFSISDFFEEEFFKEKKVVYVALREITVAQTL